MQTMHLSQDAGGRLCHPLKDVGGGETEMAKWMSNATAIVGSELGRRGSTWWLGGVAI
jgi:hypothetical protein